jgi:4,5-dihydroxyphthalate decarboxylase
MAGKLRLEISIADYPHTARLLSGEIPIEGVEANFIKVVPQIGAFRRMVRNLEFDVCELAPTTYIIARALGYPFVALPIFVMRRFHHSGLLVRTEAGIREPKDLEGHKVGVRAYSVTTGVWTRAIFVEEYGLDSAKVTWVVDDEEHVRELKLPPNVITTPEGRSLYEMMTAGEIAGGFSANAGLGRTGSPTDGWQTVSTDQWPDLFPDAAEREAEWYRRTDIYPMHGTIVVKDAVLAEHPWVAQSLFRAFDAAKQAWLKDLHSGAAATAGDKKYLALTDIVGPDPLPYGLAANLATIEALERAGANQKLTPRRMSIEEYFLDPEKG